MEPSERRDRSRPQRPQARPLRPTAPHRLRWPRLWPRLWPALGRVGSAGCRLPARGVAGLQLRQPCAQRQPWILHAPTPYELPERPLARAIGQLPSPAQTGLRCVRIRSRCRCGPERPLRPQPAPLPSRQQAGSLCRPLTLRPRSGQLEARERLRLWTRQTDNGRPTDDQDNHPRRTRPAGGAFASLPAQPASSSPASASSSSSSSACRWRRGDG